MSGTGVDESQRGLAEALRTIADLEQRIARAQDDADRDLQQSEARYRAIFDHNPDMTFIVGPHGVIQDLNNRATAGLGRARHALIGTKLSSLFDGVAGEVVDEILLQEEGNADALPLTGGQLVDVRVVTAPGLEGRAVTLRDVTSRVKLARELQHTRRLAALGHLASGVAHEINNPLAVLRMGLGLLRSDVPEDSHETLDEMLAHTDRIARIVENLHTFAEPRESRREVVPLRELVETAWKIAAPVASEMKFLVMLEPEDVCVRADRAQMEQVLVNLFTNAARATDGRGTVRVEGVQEDDRVALLVRDDGPGIREDLLDQIFTPFVTGYDKRRGTGLGLAITWGLVQENQSTIVASNSADGGACFELSIPAAAPPQPTSEQVQVETVEQGPRIRVLCVEDEPAVLRLVERILGPVTERFLGVGSAEEAIRCLGRERFDLLISDVGLPGMSGEDLVRHALETYPGLQGRAVLMSGMFRDEIPGVSYLQKPFTPERLLEMTRRLVDAAAGVAPVH